MSYQGSKRQINYMNARETDMCKALQDLYDEGIEKGTLLGESVDLGVVAKTEVQHSGILELHRIFGRRTRNNLFTDRNTVNFASHNLLFVTTPLGTL